MIITKTPLRISFFGGGTDYPAWYREHGGAVFSTTIDKYCYLTCRHLPPFFAHKTRLVWSRVETVRHADEIQLPPAREVLKHLGLQDYGLEIHHDADLPSRAGLGSSSSFTVGFLHALYALLGKPITPRQLALEAMHIEQERLRESVGSQDQVAAAFGGLNRIEFGGADHISVTPIELPPARREAFQDHLMLFFTGLARNASEVAAEQIRLTPQKVRELETMRQMVDDGIQLVRNGDFDGFGRLLNESWQIKRTLTARITTDYIDEIYATGRSAGAMGGKLLGAGGGGFMLFFVKPECQDAVRKALATFLHVPVKLEPKGSEVIYRYNGEPSVQNNSVAAGAFEPVSIPVAVLCGGLGTRLRSVVADRPKVLAEVGGEPFLGVLLDRLFAQGVSRVVLCVGYRRQQIADYIAHARPRRPAWGVIDFSEEDEPLGTGGAIRHAQPVIGSDEFFVVNGDTITDVDLRELHRFHSHRGAALSIAVTRRGDTAAAGTIHIEQSGRVVTFAEKTGQPGGWLNAGTYIMHRRIVSHMPEGAFSLEEDFFPRVVGLDTCYGFPANTEILDIGTPERYDAAKRRLG